MSSAVIPLDDGCKRGRIPKCSGIMVGNKMYCYISHAHPGDILLCFLWLIVVLVFGWLASLCIAWAISPPGPIDANHVRGGPNSFILCVFGALLAGSIMIYFGYMAAPFYLSVNLANRTYELARGIRPCVIRWSGSLRDIKELRVKQVSTHNAGDIYIMQLVWTKRGRLPLMLDSTKDENKAYSLVQEAADILCIPPSARTA